MFRNYLKITLRNLLKLKVYLLVNIFGLSIGIACALLAAVFAFDEYSFDDFHEKKDQLFRIVRIDKGDDGISDRRPDVSGLMAKAAVETIPGVIDATRLIPWFSEDVLSFEQTNLKLNDLVFADANFFEIFDFKLLRGNPETVLLAPGSIVLTETVAVNLFGEVDPLGKSILGVNGTSFNVTGIVEDAPRTSHIQYNALMSWSTTVPGQGQLSFSFINNWLGQTVYTYLYLNDGVDQAMVAEGLHSLIEQNLPQRVDDYTYTLQSIGDIYLGSDGINGNRRVRLGSLQFLQILAGIAVFVLLIACVNYVNISTAKAKKRAQEIGVRKVLGAHKRNLIVQFLGDAFVLTLISALFALLFVDLFIPYFNELTGRFISTDLLLTKEILTTLLGIIVVVTLFAGGYPALVLSSMKPIYIIRGGSNQGVGGALRKIMIVFQFALSSIMIIGAVIVYQQNHYILTKDLGFDRENLLVSDLSGGISNNFQAFQTEIERHPDIVTTSISQAAMIRGTFSTRVIPEGTDQEISTEVFRVDHDFIEAWGLDVVEGRAFDPNLSQNQVELIVNEAMLRLVGWQEGTEKTIKLSPQGQAYPVIGVVKDFNFAPLTTYTVDPMVMYIDSRKSNMTVKVSGNNMNSVLSHMENVWNQFENRVPFNYVFVDDYLENRYQAQSKFLDLVTIFSLISIFIACLGLYGLTSFMIEQRTKEIGIRKVLGASVTDVLFLINKKFVLLVFIAFLIAAPLGYLFTSQWLDGFAYRIPIGLLAFVIAGVAVFAIALITTSQQALKASKLDPVQSLRYE